MFKRSKLEWRHKAPFIYAAAGLAVVVLAAGWFWSRLDREDPWVKVEPASTLVVLKSAFTLQCGDQSSGLKEAKVILQQDSQEKVVLSRTFPPGGEAGTTVALPFTLEPKSLGFKEGQARLTASVKDRSWRNWFQGRSQSLSRDLDIDLVPLTVSFISVSHLLKPGGTGQIMYRLNKTAKESGVLVGRTLYRGYPNPKGGQGEYAALFPVPREAVGTAAVEIIARSAVGEPVRQPVTLKLKPRRWRSDNINLSDNLLRHVAATFAVGGSGDLLAGFLEVNRELRRLNHDKVKEICSQSQEKPLWQGAFQRYLGKPMARFGDKRSYVLQGKVVDQQTHLGEDLANLLHTPVPAANRGLVVLAEPLGIYGQTVMLDHGLGVCSMYSHLGKIEVKAGDKVEKGKVVGLSGATGLAGGDHLHYAVLVQGEFVDPVEWWDAHWLKDQVEGLWGKTGVAAAAAGTGAVVAAPTAEAPVKKKGKGKKSRGKERRY